MNDPRSVLILPFFFLMLGDSANAQWTQTNGPYGGFPSSFAVSPNGAGGNNLFVGTRDSVYLSTNNGTSWTAVNHGLYPFPNNQVEALAVSGVDLFAGTSGGVFRFSNNGTSWIGASTGLTIPVVALAVSGTNLFAGAFYGGVFRSTDNGASWTAVNNGLPSYPNNNVGALAVSGTNLFAGTDSSGVFLSTNNGTSWTKVNSGLTSPYVTALAVSGTNLFAGIDVRGVWTRPLSEMITPTSVEGHSTGVPAHFSLAQNYPNPFNPSTTIRYGLPQRADVSLVVFNTLGQQVATLVNGSQDAGYHEAKFDGSNLASGIYFYRIQAGGFVQTKKFVLLR